MKKKFLIIGGILLVIIGLLLLYFGQAPVPSILIVIGYILFGLGLIPEDKKKNDDKDKKKKEE